MHAGARRAWPTWCAIPANIPTPSSRTSQSPIRSVTFTKDDVALVYGSRWKQRYFKKVGDDYFPLPVQWDVAHKIWRRYFVPNGADWWAPLYPPDNFQRPTGPLCDGCHSVNYDIKQQDRHRVERRLREMPRSGRGACQEADARHHSQSCPLRLRPCQRHLHPVPLPGPAAEESDRGKVLRLAGGLRCRQEARGLLEARRAQARRDHLHPLPGRDRPQEPHAGERLRRQPDVCPRRHLLFSCHDPHGAKTSPWCARPATRCASTATAQMPQAGPHAPTVEAHTHHKAGSPGNECIACHMPKIEQTIADQNVRSHTFHFVTPGDTDALKIPNACNLATRTNPPSGRRRRWSRGRIARPGGCRGEMEDDLRLIESGTPCVPASSVAAAGQLWLCFALARGRLALIGLSMAPMPPWPA